MESYRNPDQKAALNNTNSQYGGDLEEKSDDGKKKPDLKLQIEEGSSLPEREFKIVHTSHFPDVN